MAEYVWKRPGRSVLWFRRRVPDELRAKVGKTVIQECLNTRNPQEAAQLARLRAAQLDAEWNRLRFGPSNHQVVDRRELLQWGTATLMNDDLEARRTSGDVYQQLPQELPAVRPDAVLSDPNEMLRAMSKAIGWASDRAASGLPMAEELLTRFAAITGRHIDGKERAELRGLIDSLMDRLMPKIAERSADPVEIVMANPLEVPRVADASTARELINAYYRINQTAERVRSEFELSWKRLAEVCGTTVERLKPDQVTDERFTAFRDILLQLPAVMTKRERELPLAEQIQLEGAKLSPASVNKATACVSAVFAWGKREKLVAHNPAEGRAASIKVKKSKTARPNWNDAQVKKLIGHLSAIRKDQESFYWICQLMLRTGARREEVCQLKPSDVRQEDGVWVFEIHDRGDNSTKNDASNRTVPVPQVLIDDGFLKYADKRPAGGMLFDVSKSNKTFGDAVGKRFARMLDELQIAGPVMHGLRGYFKTVSRRASVAEDIHDRITGHTNDSVGRTYGVYELKTLKTAIDRVKFG